MDRMREPELRTAQCTFGRPLLRFSACNTPRQAPAGRTCSGAPKPLRSSSFCSRRRG